MAQLLTLGSILVIPLIIITAILFLPRSIFRRFDERVSKRNIPSKDFLKPNGKGVVHFDSMLRETEHAHGKDTSDNRNVAAAEAVH